VHDKLISLSCVKKSAQKVGTKANTCVCRALGTKRTTKFFKSNDFVRLVQSAQQSFLKTMTLRLFKVGKREKNILSCAVEKTHVKNKILPCVFFFAVGPIKKCTTKMVFAVRPKEDEQQRWVLP
jgi:hypothetical protein